MEDKDIPSAPISNWKPITDQQTLAYLGKFGEELCECGSAVFRCIIQGINEAEPTTGKINKRWLEDEVADVLALLEHAVVGLGLDRTRITDRTTRKFHYKKPWFESLNAPEQREIDRLRRENSVCRATLAKSAVDCPYCGLPAKEMNRCASRFQGCGRADDIMNDPCGVED